MKLVFNSKNKDIYQILQDGRKKIETRSATIKYKKLKVGDVITFSCRAESFERKIRNITYFDSINHLLKYNPLDILTPLLGRKMNL